MKNLWVIFASLQFAECLRTQDNYIIGTPVVDCESERFMFEIETKHDFGGRIFIRGHSHKKECIVDFSTVAARNGSRKAELAVDYHTCGVDRIRSFDGVTFGNTIIVQFHGTFITQGDKSFHVFCFYGERQHSVTSDFDVSMIPTQDVSHDMELPSCTYSIRAETPNGPVVRTSTIGDLVYHRWECTRNTQVYGMLVHSCLIEDEGGRETVMVDPIGCAVDVSIVADLSYNDDLNLAYTPARAFKYPDGSYVRFRCQVRICTKMDGGCKGLTPPQCETSRKIRRSVSEYMSLATDEKPHKRKPRQFVEERAPLIEALSTGEEAFEHENSATRANIDVVSDDVFIFDPTLEENKALHPVRKTNYQEPVRSFLDPQYSAGDAYRLLTTMPQQRQSSSYFDGTASAGATTSSDQRRSTLRRGTDATTMDVDNAIITQRVHASQKELCMNRILLICLLSGFVLFFVGCMSYTYVWYVRARASKSSFFGSTEAPAEPGNATRSLEWANRHRPLSDSRKVQAFNETRLKPANGD